ncbi:MAG: hypothetical protein ABIH11_02710 [Candidatus Altiarchaeota archaeon]
MRNWKALLCLTVIAGLAGLASAAVPACGINIAEFSFVIEQLKTIGEAGAVLMITFEGAKYITSTSAEERESNRRGVIYVVIGIILINVAVDLVSYFMCST